MGIKDIFKPTVSDIDAAKMGYVNAGTDKRIGGDLGRALGKAQSDLSFKSATPPVKRIEHIGNVIVETATAPNGRAHYAIAITRKGGRWATLRFGWRFDPNWGDAYTIGHNPQPEIVGGYIADVVVKLNADKTFIDEGIVRYDDRNTMGN